MEEERMFLIEEDVPMPEKQTLSKAQLLDMKVGDSIAFPKEWRSKIQSKATRLKQESREYTIRVVDADTCRIWRTQ